MSSSPLTSNAVTLLLVEDDAVDSEALQRALRKQRIENPLIIARDGVEALAVLRGETEVTVSSPYVLLLDINMPRMNGIEFLRELRSDPALARSVVFVLTTSDSVEDKRAAYDHHVAGYIVKSRAGANFQPVVNLLRSYWQLVELPPGAVAA